MLMDHPFRKQGSKRLLLSFDQSYRIDGSGKKVARNTIIQHTKSSLKGLDDTTKKHSKIEKK